MNLKTLTHILLALALSVNSISQQKIHVSPLGSDANNGSKKSPLQSLSEAVKRIHKAEKQSLILLEEGDYYLNKTVYIENIKNLTITGIKDAKVTLHGSIEIPVNYIKSLNREDSIPVKEKHYQNIYKVDLAKLDLNLGTLSQVGYGQKVKACWAEPILNGIVLNLARWPNKGFTKLGEVIDCGSSPSKYERPSRGAIFCFDNKRLNKWIDETDLWLYGYFAAGWADDAVKVKSIDSTNNTIQTLHPSHHTFISGHDYNRWFAYNAISELDNEEEYFIDRKNNVLYFYTKQKIKTLEISQLTSPLISIRNSTSININNVNFNGSRDRALIILNSDNVTLSNSEIKNMGSYAILIDQGCRNCSVYNCLVKETGVGGIILKGGIRAKLIAGNNAVVKCTITNFNRIDGAYRPAIGISGVGNNIDGCRISHSPSMAIRLKGNNHLISNNFFHHICQEVNDQGVIYIGRDPSERGNIVRGNYFSSISTNFDNTSVYLDDGACGMLIENNVFTSAGRYAILIGGGSDITVKNNLIYNGENGIHIDNRVETRSNKWIQPDGLFEKKMNAVSYNQEPFKSQYPNIENYFATNGAPTNIIITDNEFTSIKTPLHTKGEWAEFNNNLINSPTDSISKILEIQKTNKLTLPPILKGFGYQQVCPTDKSQ